MAKQTLSIGEFSRLTGVSVYTLRFYETEGILQPIARAANGHRLYRQDDQLWISFVLKLKHTGMPLGDIKTYAALRMQGDVTIQARLHMLEAHQARLAQKLYELQTYAGALDHKIQIYQEMMAQGPAPHDEVS